MNELISPGRRQFLKRSSPIALGAAAMAICPKTAAALVKRGIANPSFNPSPPPPQPGPAATWNYNTIAFLDHFDSLSNIDVNNTLNPGYKWYTSMNFGSQTGDSNVVLPASALSASSSILTISPPSQIRGNYIGINTFGATGVSPNVSRVGSSFSPLGCYIEARIKYDPALANTPPGFPAFWTFDNSLILAQANGLTFPSNGYTELDVFEAVWAGAGSGAPIPSMALTDWVWYGSQTFQAKNQNGNNNPNAGNFAPNDGLWHTYGVLWVPQSKNAGTGLIKRYYDGIDQTNCDAFYNSTSAGSGVFGSPVGWMTCIDNSDTGFTMLLGTGKDWPMQVDYVVVWS